MKITRISPVTSKENTLDLDITQEQFNNWQNGQLIQNAMPNLSADEREFLISGMYPGEFDSVFSDEENEDFYPFDFDPFDFDPEFM